MPGKSDELSSQPNIGKTLAEKLILAGIENAVLLKSAGSENAFIRLKAVDPHACINMLYAIEGAIQGIRCHDLDKARKEELREFFRML